MAALLKRARAMLQKFDALYRANIPSERLALVRILLGGFCVFYFSGRFSVFARAAALDPAGFRPVGIVSVLSAPLAVSWSIALQWLTLLCAVLFAIGYRYRITAPIFALLVLWLTSYRSSWGMIYHSENLLFWHVAILAGSNAAAALSLDSRKAARQHEVSGWALRLIMVVTAATYFLAGVAKLRGTGLAWADGDALRNHIAYNTLRKIELGGAYSELSVWLLEHQALFVLLAWGTLLLELSGPFVLGSRRAAQCWALGMFVFHWGIGAVMDIPFLYPLSGIAFVAYFSLERLMRRIPWLFRAQPSSDLVSREMS